MIVLCFSIQAKVRKKGTEEQETRNVECYYTITNYILTY
jgi:hypothetical protein